MKRSDMHHALAIAATDAATRAHHIAMYLLAIRLEAAIVGIRDYQ